MSPWIVLLVWFPTYLLSLHIFISRIHTVLQDSAFGVGDVSTTINGMEKGGWLARLGWGLGEASVEALETSPLQSYEARIAFFGRAISEDGTVGWLVPLDSIVGPCPTSSTPTDDTQQPSVELLEEYEEQRAIYERYRGEEDDLEDIENTGCPPLCPLYANSGGFSTAERTLENTPFDPSDQIGTRPWDPFPNTTWIALVRRGTCSFAAKALAAQTLGAMGMIVGGLDENLISMSASGSTGGNIEIASIFVGARSYANLTRLITESDVRIAVDSPDIDPSNIITVGHSKVLGDREVRTILVKLTGEPPWAWYTPILSLLIVLSLPSLLTLCTLLIHRVRAERREREQRAPEGIVKGLPVRVWTGVKWEKDLERGPSVQPEEQSERSPLLPINDLGEREEQRRGYGAIVSDAEPSTSAPRPSRLDMDHAEPVVELGDKEDPLSPTTREAVSSAVPIPNRTAQTDQPFLAIPNSPTHAQEESGESDETIPRPPWFTSQSECAICLCDFEVGDRVRVLPCGHIFHVDEVDGWLLKQRKVCPVCKYDVTNPPTALVPASSTPPAISTLAGDPYPASTPATSSSSGVTASRNATPLPNEQELERNRLLAEFAGGDVSARDALVEAGRRENERQGWIARWLDRGQRRGGDGDDAETARAGS